MSVFDTNLLARWTAGEWLSPPPACVHGLAIDSRSLAAGNLFIAIRGTRFDGHRFIAEAFAKGAAAAVVDEADYRAGPAQPILRVRNTQQALQDMAAAYRRSLGLLVIAVTGSVGKTTVKEMLADILASSQLTARTQGNWNNNIGLPLSLLNVEPAARFGVFELGSNHPGELAALCQILAPSWGLVTTLAPVHMEFFKSLAGVAEEKSTLLRSLPPAGTAVLCSDDQCYGQLRAAAPGRVLSVSLAVAADYSGIFLRGANQGLAEILEQASGERFQFQMPLPGRHQLLNALYAVAVSRALGLSWQDIRRPLEAYQAQPMRWESHSLNNITVINDAYNASPISMLAALQTFAEIAGVGRKWLVLGDMLELGANAAAAHAELGRRVAQGAWSGLLVIGELGAIIAQSAAAAGMDQARIFCCQDQAQAAQRLSRLTGSGDAVLLKGSRGQHLEEVLRLWRALALAKKRG